MASSSNQPNATLYLNNLNDKVNKDELKTQLYALFATYGKIIDIVASKSQSMRGQAFLHIDYAKTKSYATSRREDPNFVAPTAANASALVSQTAKRQRDDETADGERDAKREKSEEDEEEMEIDDDDEPAPSTINTSSFLSEASNGVPNPSQQPSARLLCTNLPQEVTDSVLSVLFQQ
ncbi:hypothetical protein C0991_006067 [Blastosporella zonata]|nr:hypothetical protein C0991_006067 [Blastosporella zonata]